MSRPELCRFPHFRPQALRIRLLVLGSTAVAIASLAGGHASRPTIIYNATASAPAGWYLVRPPVRLARGDLVLAVAPDGARTLAAERGYLPTSVPLVKRIAALPPDQVCADASAIEINGHVAAVRLAADIRGRTLPWWTGCAALSRDDVLLLAGDVADSFDSRYFGPVPEKNILGRLTPLWTR